MVFSKPAYSPTIGYYCQEVNDLSKEPGDAPHDLSIGSCSSLGYNQLVGTLPPPSTDKIFVKDCSEVTRLSGFKCPAS